MLTLAGNGAGAREPLSEAALLGGEHGCIGSHLLREAALAGLDISVGDWASASRGGPGEGRWAREQRGETGIAARQP